MRSSVWKVSNKRPGELPILFVCVFVLAQLDVSAAFHTIYYFFGF